MTLHIRTLFGWLMILLSLTLALVREQMHRDWTIGVWSWSLIYVLLTVLFASAASIGVALILEEKDGHR